MSKSRRIRQTPGTAILPCAPVGKPSLDSTRTATLPCSTDAHCIVAKHCFLPSSPCSLFSTQNPLAALTARGFCVEKKVRAALLSRALERTIIAAGGLNGRVRDGNGCLTPASGTNQRDWLRPSQSGEWRCSRLQHSTDPGRVPPGRLSAALHAARPRPPHRGGIAGGRRPDLTAYQKRYGERLAALAHPPCQAGVLPAAFRDLRPGRLISGGAWRLDAFSAYPFATWLPGGADGSTTGTPEVARPRSSRTRGRSRQPSCACGG